MFCWIKPIHLKIEPFCPSTLSFVWLQRYALFIWLNVELTVQPLMSDSRSQAAVLLMQCGRQLFSTGAAVCFLKCDGTWVRTWRTKTAWACSISAEFDSPLCISSLTLTSKAVCILLCLYWLGLLMDYVWMENSQRFELGPFLCASQASTALYMKAIKSGTILQGNISPMLFPVNSV